MTKAATAYILACRALNQPCEQASVDWAIQMLEEGSDGHFLGRLAGMLPPHNRFEIASLRDLALREQGISDLPVLEAVTNYAVELLRLVAANEADPIETVATIKELSLARKGMEEFSDFEMLYWAYADLRDVGSQYYWPTDVSLDNIGAAIVARAEQFLRERHKENSSVGN